MKAKNVSPLTLSCGLRLSGMKRCPALVLLLALLAPRALASDRIQLQFNTDQPDAVLAILASPTPTDADWQRLFKSEPYVRLKQREAHFHNDFTDDDFRKFVLSPDLRKQAPELRRTLDAWKKADLKASAQRVLAYLPAQAYIHAKVFPVIKPSHNSFVFEPSTDAAIFLYLDPEESAAKFENKVAHELHHIGFSSVESASDAQTKSLSPNVKAAVEWMGAFGEGFAMLAAAGGPDVDPQATSSAQDHARWDHDMANFNPDLRKLDQFFANIVNGKFKSRDEIDDAGGEFFGEQGPWYTVGYKMAVIVEKRYGRDTLIDCMVDPRELLVRYNAAAAELNRGGKEHLELWSPELLAVDGFTKR